MATRVEISGPWFDGRSDMVMRDLVRDVEQVVAEQALSEVQRILDVKIRHPTPYYETQITVERSGRGMTVHDRGIIYGHWLEGTGSRNAPVTSFRGYRAFGTATEVVRPQVGRLTAHVVARHVRRLT